MWNHQNSSSSFTGAEMGVYSFSRVTINRTVFTDWPALLLHTSGTRVHGIFVPGRLRVYAGNERVLQCQTCMNLKCVGTEEEGRAGKTSWLVLWYPCPGNQVPLTGGLGPSGTPLLVDFQLLPFPKTKTKSHAMSMTANCRRFKFSWNFSCNGNKWNYNYNWYIYC